MKSVGRQVELDWLHQFYHAKRAAWLILYGRSRVGKTQHGVRQPKSGGGHPLG